MAYLELKEGPGVATAAATKASASSARDEDTLSGDENAPAAALALALASSPRRSRGRPGIVPSAPVGTGGDDHAESEDAPDHDDGNGSADDDDDEDEDDDAVHPQTTRVDGKGLWRSWKRNFKNKLAGMLDLVDNSLDASIVISGASPPDFVGRVHIYPDAVEGSAAAARGAAAAASNSKDGGEAAAPTVSKYFAHPDRAHSAPEMVFSGDLGPKDRAANAAQPEEAAAEVAGASSTTNTGLCIVNNSLRPIRPLARVLEVYNSSKIHSGAGDIGENGVGLKQGCATLSDLSFVFVKNGKDGYVEWGIIAESLQKAEGCYLPAFRFPIPNEDDAIQSIRDQMTALFSQPKHQNVAECVKKYGSASEGVGNASDMEKGTDRLLKHFDSVLNFFDNKFVFAVVLDNISSGNATNDRMRQGAADPIKDLREAIPYTYLHIPPSFDFRIGNSPADRDKVVFQYWPQRLVELSAFTVMVNDKLPWHDPQSHKGTYKLRVFVGFDRTRLGTGRTAASLFIYSRESGRLIKEEPDARCLLGLSNAGTMYCQGLTVLIDDVDGRLPLNPTKQDVAFGEQAHGETHKDNLFAWVGCVAKFFYEYHLAKFGNKRTILTAKLTKFGTVPLKKRLKELDRSQMTTFNAQFGHHNFCGKKSIRIDRRTAEVKAGADTHFSLVADAPRPAPIKNPPARSSPTHDTEPAGKKRKIDGVVSSARVQRTRNVPQQTQQETDAVIAPTSPVTSAGKAQGNPTANRVKREVGAEASEVIDLANDDDDEESVAESVASTKDDYKDLCQQLSFKVEQRKDAAQQMKKENRRLKEAIAELKTKL